MARRKAEAEKADDALLTLLNAGLRLQAGGDLWRVSGNTLPHRLLLRDAGGTWNKVEQCWEFSGEERKPHVQSFIMNTGLTGAFLLVIAYGL